MNIGGFVLGLVMLGLFIWFGLSRLSRAITHEIRTVSLATLRLQHEAERLARREKVVFRADSDVLALLEQAILDASGESVHVRLLPNGWLSSPPLMAVVDQTRRATSSRRCRPIRCRPCARRHGLTQLLLGQATDLTAYPIDALNSTPFIVDDLSAAFGYVLARHQAPRRPLPRTDRWYLYIARPRTSRWPRGSSGACDRRACCSASPIGCPSRHALTHRRTSHRNRRLNSCPTLITNKPCGWPPRSPPWRRAAVCGTGCSPASCGNP